MEQATKTWSFGFNYTFFGWCLGLPVSAFIITLFLTATFSVGNTGVTITNHNLQEFINYYDQNSVGECLKIFLNNFCAALVVVYFTPFILYLRQSWEKWRNVEISLSPVEKLVLYIFPGLFLIRQAVSIAFVLNNLSWQINKNVILTFMGIILPHGFPELLAFSLAGAVGMEVTRKLLLSPSTEGIVSARTLSVLLVFIAFCAYVEVYLTPKFFALIMSASGVAG